MTKKRPGVKKPSKSKSWSESRRPRGQRTPRSSVSEVAATPAPFVSAARSAADMQRRHEAREAALGAIDAALDKKALMPVLLDVTERATYTDYIAVVSGRSDRQVEAIASNIEDAMALRGYRLLGREGVAAGRWTLLDFGDVVVHVFYHPVREVYDIEGLWVDAPRIDLKIPPEAQLYQADALYGAL